MYIALPIPTIILQIPPMAMVLPQNLRNECYGRSNSRCTYCGYQQSEEREVDNDEMDEEIDVDSVKEEVVDEVHVKKEEIKEMFFRHSFDEQSDSKEHILQQYVNLDESRLSPRSKANIKDETYDWGSFSIERILGNV